MMSANNIKQPRISDVILERISSMILDGSLKAGQKLPPERELATQLQTSRPSVRAALGKLEAQGLVVRVQGGGTYVSDKVESSFSDPLVALFHDREDFKYDMLEYRHVLEEAACFLAAERATDEEKREIERRYQAWLALHEEKEQTSVEAEADLAFHLAIAEASHNVMLPHAMRSSLKILHQSVTSNLDRLYLSDKGHATVRQQHEAMLEAIMAGDGVRARDAVRSHLLFVKKEMEKADLQKFRKDRLAFGREFLNLEK